MSSARKPRGTSSRGTGSARPSGSSARGGASSSSSRPAASSRPSSSSRPSGQSSSRPAGKSLRSREVSPKNSGSGLKQPAQPSLLECVQKRFEKDVFESAAVADPGWKILIVDDISMKVISAAVGMYDIMERKITLVESLEKKRAPFKDMGAIYVLSPTKESVARLIDDFSDKSKILYGSNIFVYFLGALPPQLLSQIKHCKHLLRRLKALSEVNVDFLVREQRAFTLDVSIPFSGYFLRSGSSGPAEVPVADKLVTLCATMNEYPYIRYKQTSGICNSVATVFKMKMDEYVASNPSWWYHGSGKSGTSQERDRSTILLLDRASDCLTPLMHDFTYQAMVHDLLTMEGDKITYKAEGAEDPSKVEDKDVLLNEKDKLWVELRGKHIAQVIEILSSRINEICKSSTTSAFSGGGSDGNMSLSQLASALKALPEYREVMSKLSQHMHLSHECMDEFNRNNLMDLSDIEQTLATGKDEEGRSPKLTEIINRVEGSLLRMTDVKERLRLVLVATISQNGLSSADRDRLLRAAQLGRDELLTLDSLSKLGIQTVNNMGAGSRGGGGAMGFFGSKNKIQNSGSFDEDSEYASSRYVPALKGILNDLVTNALSVEEYPSVIPMPSSMTSAAGAGSARRRNKGLEGSARKKKGATDKWSRTGNSQTTAGVTTSFQGGRNMVFIVGGMSYLELKVARDIMEKESREIVVGSTRFVGPDEFIDDLMTLAN